MGKKLRNGIVAAAVVSPFVPFLFWCGGFNFDKRGADAVFCVLLTVAVTFNAFFVAQVYTD